MRVRLGVMVMPLAVAMTVGCTQDRVTDPGAADQAAGEQGSVRQQAAPPGSGLVLDSLTNVPLLGDVVINQAVITNFALIENTVGQIIGLEAEGVLQLTGGVLGTDVVTENFHTLVTVTSSGPGKCDLVTIDLGSISVDALGVANVDVPAATLTGRGSGAVGSLLCNLGAALSGLIGGGAGGLVNAINNLI